MDHGQCWPESDAFFVRSELGSIMEGYTKNVENIGHTLGNRLFQIALFLDIERWWSF